MVSIKEMIAFSPFKTTSHAPLLNQEFLKFNQVIQIRLYVTGTAAEMIFIP